MTKQAIIERTVKIINLLPPYKAEEISDFADFIIKRYEEQGLIKDMANIMTDSHSFDFLKNEEDLYTENDLKEKYHD